MFTLKKYAFPNGKKKARSEFCRKPLIAGLKRRKLIICSAAAVTLLCLILFVKQRYMLPIVMYHSVSPAVAKGNLLAVSAATFEKQMSFLKRHHYNVAALGNIKDYISGKKKIPGRSIVLTFDDGYKDNYTYAFPILKKYNFPAAIFIIVSEVGRPDRLSWEEIKEMQACGLITFASHTFTHPFLNSLRSAGDLKREISGSKSALEDKLGRSVEIFSYPSGRFNTEVIQAVKDAGYQMAVATNPGKKFPNNDRFILKRLRISENASSMFVFWFETTGYYNFIRENRHK